MIKSRTDDLTLAIGDGESVVALCLELACKSEFFILVY